MQAKVDMKERQREDAGKGRYDREAARRFWQRYILQRGSAKILAKLDMTGRQREDAGLILAARCKR